MLSVRASVLSSQKLATLTEPAGRMLPALCASPPAGRRPALTSVLCVSARSPSVCSTGCTTRSCCSATTRRPRTSCSCCDQPLRSRKETWWKSCCPVTIANHQSRSTQTGSSCCRCFQMFLTNTCTSLAAHQPRTQPVPPGYENR